jgi:hypothetical protein
VRGIGILKKNTGNKSSGSLINALSSKQNAQSCSKGDSVTYYYYSGDDPLWKQNNKFGLYIYAEKPEYLSLAKKLVNSNGGSWGYVLLPYNVNDTDEQKWGRVFDTLQKDQLIPIIQLYDVDPTDYKQETINAATFLNSFVWPIKYKYVSVYNEPNDASFWYGKVDPANYAEILKFTIDTFKSENSDFFMLNGAFNASASTSKLTMDELDYMKQMNVAEPGIFKLLDGWASHSYPQPNFAGSPDSTGRWSIRAYVDELAFLKSSFGITKDLPVFITETGWAHAEGDSYDAGYLTDDQVAANFKAAYENYWLKDARVRAVIPFTIWYQPPFDHFAWVNKDNVPYKHYDVVKSIKKVHGEPPVLEESSAEVNSCI